MYLLYVKLINEIPRGAVIKYVRVINGYSFDNLDSTLLVESLYYPFYVLLHKNH